MITSTPRTWRVLFTLFACSMLIGGTLSANVAAQDVEPTEDPAQLVDPTLPQDSTPEATQESESTAEPDSSTPEATVEDAETAGASRVDLATTAGAPATLAHGLAYYDGDDLVWQVQEIEVPVIDDAASETGEAVVIVQREGQSIVRNEVTGRRALLDPGEAFFLAAGDAYTVMAEDDGAVIWKFSLVDPDEVAGDAFYESPVLTDVSEDTYDFQLVRYALQPGDTADLPNNSGAGMVMPGSGEVQVDHGGELSLLGLDGSHGQGQLLRQPTSITNDSDEPVVVFYPMLGDTVSDDSAGSGTGSSTTTTDATDGGDSATTADDATSADTAAEGDTGSTTSPSDQPEGGPYRAQINIYAQEDIYLTVTVDGTVWFDGTLPAGGWSGAMSGTSFEVYTSSGINTLFTNACGVEFYMGEEAGEAWYTLTADANSCPPPGE